MQQYAEGRLTAGELDDRSLLARQARTYAHLDGLVVDLPVRPPSTEVRRMSTTADLARLGTDPAHPQTMTGGMSSLVRRGIWTVPAYLNISAGLATVKLDFQQAICPHDVVDIHVSAGVGAVLLCGSGTRVVTTGTSCDATSSGAVRTPCRRRPTVRLAKPDRLLEAGPPRRRTPPQDRADQP